MDDFPITSSSCTVTIESYLNPHSKQYQNILVLDKMPLGPLSTFVVRFNPRKLSPFQVDDDDDMFNRCHFAIRRNDRSFLTVDDIPSLLSYLTSNGYTIDSQLTKVVQKTNHNKHFVCIFSKT